MELFRELIKKRVNGKTSKRLVQFEYEYKPTIVANTMFKSMNIENFMGFGTRSLGRM